MGKFVSFTALAGAALGCLLLASCGSSSSTRVVNNQVPAVVSMTPGPNVSLEVGKTQSFSVSATNSAGTAIQETFTFQSSNPAILTIANNGQACAGTWDSLTAPSLCTPGGTGLAQLTAEANGVISPAINVYVHQHITNVVIAKVPGQTPTLSSLCLTKAAPLLGPGPESELLQAFAYSGPTGANDITASVGPFTWQSVAVPGQTSASTSVALSSAPASSAQCLKGINGQCLNLEVATAATPGSTEIVANVGGVNSQPMAFTTCPIQSITITPANNSSSTSFILPTGNSLALNATATDTLGLTLTSVPLTWSSSNPVSVSVSGSNSGNVYSSVGTVRSSQIGSGAVTVSCTPPACNGGIVPSSPIYSSQGFEFTVTSTGGSPPSPTAYATTSACSTTTQGCTARIVPITRTSATAAFSAGNPLAFPFAPNSVKYDAQGSNAYFGVRSVSFGAQGLMVFSGSSISQLIGAAGRVLAISPDSSTVILSDTVDSPSRVYICTNCNTSSRSATPFLLPNAIAAAFSPDNLKAYILASSACPGTSSTSCLMIYSKLDAPQFIPLSGSARDVAFLGNGSLAYIGGSSGSAALATCDHPNPGPSATPVGFNAQLVRALPDGQSVIALDPPNIQIVSWPSPAPSNPPAGCVSRQNSLFPKNNLDISTSVVGPPINLGLGSFAPTQFLISPDGSTAYILGQIQQAVSFPVTAVSCALNTSGTGCSSPYATYTYSWNSGPTIALGANITVAGTPAGDNGTFPVIGISGPAPNGSGGNVGTFTVANSGAVPAGGLTGSASGSETLKFDFIVAFNLQSQTSSDISLVGSATPLSASISPAGDLLFVGADDDQVHVVNTATLVDTDQVPLTFPQNSSLCVGPGSPPTALQSLLNVFSANQDAATGTTTFSYSLNSGPPVAVGNPVKVTGMADPGNNGTFVATSVGSGSFTAVNPIGVTATGQNGSGSAGLACNPDMVVAKP